jgi:hypothetical protein
MDRRSLLAVPVLVVGFVVAAATGCAVLSDRLEEASRGVSESIADGQTVTLLPSSDVGSNATITSDTPDGTRVIFASNWGSSTGRPVQVYVADLTSACTKSP